MTRGQFEILLAKLDDIDSRLREVEKYVAGMKAVRNARQEMTIDSKWKAGIVASIVGALITLAAKVYDALSGGSNG